MFQNLKGMNRKFLGEGVNHEGRPFKASFDILSQPNIDGLTFNFEAIANDGSPLHIESSLLGKNMQGKNALWVLSSNHPGVFERVLKSEVAIANGSKYIFGFGNTEDKNSYREEIHMELTAQTIRYTYFWGLPGGDFRERSGGLMKEVK